MDSDFVLYFIFGSFIAILIKEAICSFYENIKKIRSFEKDKYEFAQQKRQFDNDVNSFLQKTDLIEKEKQKLLFERNGLKKIAEERQKGCPWLEDEYDRLFALRDLKEEEFTKKHRFNPAPKAAERIKEANSKRRRAEKNERIYKNLVEYYESIAPFLLELKEEVVTDENIEELQKYTEEERLDKVVEYLTIDEYRNLSITERNQIALDRYWKRPKSNAHIGRIYERFIGYQYETKGFDVSFEGIFKGLEDLGRDLICTKGKTAHIVQCKYWSKFKTIHEKHIFQLFGSMYQYRKQMLKDSKYTKVIGLFCTTTKVSDLAHEFAKDIGVDIRDNFEMDYNYPCIKCNINETTKEKIYHLPFDQMYDKVKIEIKKGEFYCKTVKEAEEKGFRRAKKYFVSQ